MNFAVFLSSVSGSIDGCNYLCYLTYLTVVRMMNFCLTSVVHITFICGSMGMDMDG